MEAKKHAVWAFADANPIDRRDLRHPGRALRLRHDRQGASRPDGGAAAARARRGGLPAARHRHLQGRHGLAAGPARRARLRARQAARCWSSRRSAASSRASSRSISTTIPATSPSAWSASATRTDARLSPGPASCRRGFSSPLVARRLDRDLPGRAAARAPRRGAGRARTACIAGARARPARPISAPAARTTPRRKVPGGSAGAGRHRLPLHGELDGPRDHLADPDGRRGRELGGLLALHRAAATSSRTSARAPGTTPARWRSARRSRRAPTSPTRSSTTTPSR